MITKTRLSVLTIGNEILIGQIVDTNSAWIGEKLASIGFIPEKIVTIGDDEDQIVKSLTALSVDQDIVIMTGGLGPTKDDITVKAIAAFLGVSLVFREDVYTRIQDIFRKYNRPISPSHRDQCYLPEGVMVLHNSMGTAPGMVFKKDHFTLVSLPGVPYEMKAIFEEEVLPKVIFPYIQDTLIQETFVIAGKGETEIEDLLQPLIDEMPTYFSVAYLPGLGQVRVRLTAKSSSNPSQTGEEFDHYKNKIKETLGIHIIGEGETDLETVIGQLCIQKSLKIGTLESCTGGRVAARLASISGASDYLAGGIVAYTNDIKTNIIGVPNFILEKHGAVSEETVMSMVENGLNVLGVDLAVAISGIAGPTGGTAEKPVGTIWIAVGNSKHIETKRLQLGKKREQNIILSTQSGLNMLRLFVLKNYI